ncbi:FHA domain-containing protein [Oscillatoria acuminata]|uniref:FHA domain-containing protein n=1 Tax=Oscillatoria acuminata PCC 6304 TaxID=56110 RepID=K9TNG9_9CYAN|nr:FHA domain-containing protein [Oscillatoria acuminata]AFY84387.1 FHA domain-containing protein [Oscillatoria acuminata PCC 6304]
MSPKTAKLTQRIQEFQQFVASRMDQDATYADIAEKLEQISTTLTQGKLNLQICGRFRILNESLEDLLTRSQALAQFYQIYTTTISEVIPAKTPASTAVLVAQTNGMNLSQFSPYSLPTDRKTSLGRRPDNDIVLPNHCSLVSGKHLEIIPPRTADGNWTISDLKSTNGTFVNGQPVQGSQQILRSGDRVVLGGRAGSAQAPEFVFECQSNLDLETNPLEKAIAQADVLCLVFNPSQPLSGEEKQLIEQANKSQVSQITLVADLPPNSQGNPEILDNIKNLEEWLKNYPAQLVCLSLRSSYSQDHDATVLAVDKQDELNNFYQQVEKLGQNKLEDILIQRGTQKAMAQVARIEEICDRQQATLIEKMEATEAKLQVSDTRDLKEQLKKEIKNATQEKDALFKEIKYELSELKNNLLSENLKVGLPYKIQQFVDSLSHIVTKSSEQTHIYICLPADNSTENPTQRTPQDLSAKVHREMNRFCQEHLNYVAAHEWHRICNEYGNGGLNRLFQQTGDRFNSLVPTLNLSSADYQPPLAIDINKIFLNSSVEYPWETHYSTMGFGSYIMKNLRTNMMSIGMMLTSLSGVGAAIGLLISLFSTQAQQAEQNSGNDTLMAITTLIGFVIAVLIVISVYPKDKQDELKKNIEKITSEGCKNYKYVAKELVNKMLQLINLVLDAEEQKFKKMLEIVEEHSTDYTLEAKNTLTQLKAQEMELKKERLELEKLKRF